MSEQVSKALSVRDIVRQRTGADPDAWRLALYSGTRCGMTSACGTSSTHF
jgi:hypothetical protein